MRAPTVVFCKMVLHRSGTVRGDVLRHAGVDGKREVTAAIES